MLSVILGTDGRIGTDNKEQMANEKYQNKNMWFGAGRPTLATSNNLSVNLFNLNLGFLLMSYNSYS